MESWFYSDRFLAQQGPVEGQTLLQLNRDGLINAKSMVWAEGMERWLPFHQVAQDLYNESGDGEPVPLAVCCYSNQVLPLNEMMAYGDAWVSLAHKAPFVQHLMESGITSLQDATEDTMKYVGFWWRVLGGSIDYLVKLLPSWLMMVPFYLVTAMVNPGTGSETGQIGGMHWLAALTYGLGALGNLLVSIFYETWMVGRYQATVGKMAIGAKVVNPDGGRPTYKRALLRWLVKVPLNNVIVFAPATVMLVLVIFGLVSASDSSNNPAIFIMGMLLGFIAYAFIMALCSGVYWMAAFDDEKRMLHDRLSSTRVVKKNAVFK